MGGASRKLGYLPVRVCQLRRTTQTAQSQCHGPHHRPLRFGAATRAHFMYFIDKLQSRLGDFSQTALKNFYLASYEATGQVWTSSLPATFEEIHGYSIDKFIPALFEGQFLEEEMAKRFQQDFNKTLSHLITSNHYGKAREICNDYGLQITSESGGPGAPLHNVPVDALKALGALDVPRGEFWNKHYF